MLNAFLYIIAYILVAILAPVGVIYGIFRNPKGFGKKLLDMAVSLDQFGNVAVSEMLNDFLGEGFGDEDETISSVLGRNKRDGKLKPTGRAISWILNTLDKDHVEKSIEE